MSLHPLFWCLVTYAAGIASSSYPSLLICFMTLSMVCALFLWLRYGKNSKIILKVLLLSSASFVTGRVRYASFQHTYCKIVNKLSQQPFDCIGKIKNIRRSPSSVFKTILTIAVESIIQQGHMHPFFATIEIHTLTCTRLVDDRILLRSLRVKKLKNESFTSYLRKEWIHATLHRLRVNFFLIDRPFFSFNRFFHNLHNRLSSSFSTKFSPVCRSLFFSLFLGVTTKKGVADSIKKWCTFWGISHYLARSGLHVVLLLYGWQSLLRLVPLHFLIKELLLLCLLIFYHVLTIPSISFIRTLITFIMGKACIASSLLYKQFHVLLLTAFLLLLYNPELLFFLDFQLSFGLTCALTWFHESLLKIQRIYNIVENK